MKTKDIKKEISTLLKEFCPRVKYKFFLTTPAPPFITYQLATIRIDGPITVCSLIIDVYDFAAEAEDETLPELADAVVGHGGYVDDGVFVPPNGLERKLHKTEDAAMVFFLDTNNHIAERDVQIQRRRLVFTLKIF